MQKAVLDKAFEVYNFFMNSIATYKFFEITEFERKQEVYTKMDEIDFLSRLLFSYKTFCIMYDELQKYKKIIINDKFPEYDEIKRDYENHKECELDYDDVFSSTSNVSESTHKHALMIILTRRIIDNAFSEYRLKL